jgi:hypothetical protein
VGNIDDPESVDSFGATERQVPADDSTPVVAYDVRCIAVLGSDEVDDISAELTEPIGTNASRPFTSIVPSLVGDDHAVSGLDERLDVVVPLVPEFGKPVEQDDERVLRVTGSNDVQGDTVHVTAGTFD